MELSRKSSKRRYFKSTIVCFLTCCMFFNTSLSVALAGPEGAQVVNGQVSFQQSGYNTTITASDKSIINYSSFDIARPEIVEFIQPGSSASVLNRILSANPTNINGTLLANGRVFFVNPAGVYFGAGARVNVNQLVASALNITNSDFINGQYNFAGGNGSVINSGDISAEKVYLIGQQVANFGSISCPAGYVVMASGDRVFLGEPGTDVVLEVDAPSLPESASPIEGSGVLNEGTVDASGGTIVLAAGDIYSQAISNTGSLSASVETGEAGQIKLTANGRQVTNSGKIEASGDDGGSITIDGKDVVLTQEGVIQADSISGGAGGSVEVFADTLVADGLITANGAEGKYGYILLDPTDLTVNDILAGDIVTALSGSDYNIVASDTITVDAEIDSSAQSSSTTLSFDDEDTNNDLTINLNDKIILGANQTLTGDGTTINVASTGLIQNGIEVTANSGAAINVQPGLYQEDLVIPDTKTNLELVGAGKLTTTIQGQAMVDSTKFPLANPNIEILGDGTQIHEFTIRGPNPSSGYYASGIVIGGDNVEIYNNNIEVTNASTLNDISQGIQTYRDGNAGAGDLDGLNIHHNDFSAHGTGTAGYEGIFINHVSSETTPAGRVTINANTFSEEVVRAITTERSKTDITNNTVNTTLTPVPSGGAFAAGNSLTGILVQDFDDRDVDDVSVTGNTSSGFTQGLRVGPSAGPTYTNISVTGNTFSNNTLQVQDRIGALNIANALSNNTFDKAVTVDTGGGTLLGTIWSRIQDGIDNAPASNASVAVESGLYEEDLVIPDTKTNLELVGAGKLTTTIQGQAMVDSTKFPLANSNIEILGDGTKIHDFTIRGPDPQAGYYASGIVIGGDNVEIYNNNIEVTNASTLNDISQGIQTYRDGNAGAGDLDGLNIHHNDFSAHGTGTAGYEGIFINHVSSETTPAGRVTINANTFSEEVVRAITTERSKTDITNNTVNTTLTPVPSGGAFAAGNSLTGILVQDFDDRDVDDVSVTGNTSSGFTQGLRVGPSAGPTYTNISVTGNTFSNNTLQVQDRIGALNIANALSNNTFDKAVTVDTGGGTLLGTIWSRIQDGIDNASDSAGHTVDIMAGTYAENVTVDKILALNVPSGTATMTSLTSDPGKTTGLSGLFAANTSTDPAFQFDGVVTLEDNVTLTSNNNKAITFNSTINGSQALVLNTDGVTTFNGAVGSSSGNELVSLTTDAGGSTEIGAGTINLNGASATFNDAVLLTDNLTINETGSGNIEFASTVDSAVGSNYTLTVNSGVGATIFGDAVGSDALGADSQDDGLGSVTTNATGTTSLGGDVTTTVAQTYNDDVVLAGNVILAGSGVEFGKTVEAATDGGQSLTVNTTSSGLTKFVSTVGGNSKALSGLVTNSDGTTSLGDDVTTTVAQTYNDDVVLAGNVILAGSGVEFGKTVEAATDGGQSLTVNTTSSGLTKFVSTVGGNSKALSGLVTNSDGTTSLGDDVTTTGAQTYNDDVDLMGDVIASGANVKFASTVDGGQSLTVNSAGATEFGSTVGTGTNLTSLITDAGGTTSLGGDVTTTGDQTYNDAVTVTDGKTLTAGSDLTVATSLTGGGTLTLISTGGDINGIGKIQANTGPGNLTLRQGNALDLATLTFGNQSSTDLIAQSYNGSFTAVDTANGGKDDNAADQWNSITATAENNIVLQGSDAVEDIKIGGPLSSNSGGVSIISDNGKIYSSGDTLNVAITGYSDDTGTNNTGVDLPAGTGKAAIVILSELKDLNLGSNATLTANGSYDDSVVDDRLGVSFLPPPPSTDEAGERIDVAIYLGSFNHILPGGAGGNVTVDSTVSMAANGTMVIDAYDTVNAFGSNFTGSIPWSNITNSLEVVSRKSPTLDYAAEYNTLPHADEARSDTAPSWFGGKQYVLRGKDAVLAEVLARIEPVPLVLPKPLEPEDQGQVQIERRETELLGLGDKPELARAYPPSLNTDLNLDKAAQKLYVLMLILRDSSRIASLDRIVVEIWQDADQPIAPEQEAMIAQRMSGTPAEEWVAALTEYVDVMSTMVGRPKTASVLWVMQTYVIPQAEDGLLQDQTVAFLEAQID